MNSTVIELSDPRCRTCRHWLARPYVEHEGECRRNAPQAALAENASDAPLLVAVWPLVDAQDWCGEYQESTCS